MAPQMQGMGKLTSKFFLMREKHDHEKNLLAATARSVLVNIHQSTLLIDLHGNISSFRNSLESRFFEFNRE